MPPASRRCTSAISPTRRRWTRAGAAKQGAVSRLVQIYANRGHLVAVKDALEDPARMLLQV